MGTHISLLLYQDINLTVILTQIKILVKHLLKVNTENSLGYVLSFFHSFFSFLIKLYYKRFAL